MTDGFDRDTTSRSGRKQNTGGSSLEMYRRRRIKGQCTYRLTVETIVETHFPVYYCKNHVFQFLSNGENVYHTAF